MDRPNIVLIMADQLAAQFLPAYGHRVVKAPVLDQLAAEGVVFAAAYSNSPLCAPARATVMTGCLSDRTGVFDNAAEFRSSIPTFAHYLRLAGYRTCLVGKMHFVGPDQLHGFEERLTTDIYPADFGWTPDWTRPGERIDWWYHNMSSVKEAGVAAMTNQLEYDDEVGFLAQRRLYDFARQRHSLPFCLTISFTHPHDPYVARPAFWDRYEDSAIDAPAVPPLPYAALDPHSQRLYDACAMKEYAISADDERRARHGYYANISYIDAQIGQLLATLTTCALDRNTIVIVTSDHGDFLGELGLWYKMSFREAAARVPLIVHAPALFAPKRVMMPVGLTDLLPTMVDLANAGKTSERLPSPIDGRSLVGALSGIDDTDASVFGVYLAEAVAAPLLMLRQGPWKFIECGSDPVQLFHLSNDPHEMCNLAQAQPAVVERLRAQLAARFDQAALRRDVIASQQARLAVFKALQTGKIFPWDYQPLRAASEQYTRNHQDVARTDQTSRYPPLPGAGEKPIGLSLNSDGPAAETGRSLDRDRRDAVGGRGPPA
jgi:choline-sulfatase